MFCTRCGNSARDHEKRFCTKCGLKLRPIHTSGTQASDTRELATDKKTSFSGRSRGFLESLIGQTIDQRYLLESPIGFGAMGAVYRARRINIGDTAAIKVLKPEHIADSRSVERFQREAQVGAKLRHPNAVTVYDFGVSEDNLIYFVMELVDGDNLRTMLEQNGPIAQTTAVDIIAQVCEALEEAHRHQIVHRDLKPENIIVRRGTAGMNVKVLDFGVAAFRTPNQTKLTGGNGLVGTPFYMSPEQWRGEPVDQRSDIYSLGLILFEMLAGRAPSKLDEAAAPGLRELNPQVSVEIEAVVMHALAKDTDARPQSASELARELRAALRGYHPRMFEQQTVAEQHSSKQIKPKAKGHAAGPNKRMSFVQATLLFLMIAATATGAGLYWAKQNGAAKAQTIDLQDGLVTPLVVSTPEPVETPVDEVPVKAPTPSPVASPKAVKRAVAPVKAKVEKKVEPVKKQPAKETARRGPEDRPRYWGPDYRGGFHGGGDGMGWLRERWMRERAFRWGYRRGFRNAGGWDSNDSRDRDEDRSRRRRWREEREEREKREK